MRAPHLSLLVVLVVLALSVGASLILPGRAAPPSIADTPKPVSLDARGAQAVLGNPSAAGDLLPAASTPMPPTGASSSLPAAAPAAEPVLAWEQVNLDGFDGGSANVATKSMAVFNDALYVGTANGSGAEVWRSATGDPGSWTRVVSAGFGNAFNSYVSSLAVFDNALYACAVNYRGGAEVWRSASGAAGSWEQIANAGFGNRQNMACFLGVFNNALYAGTWQGNPPDPTPTPPSDPHGAQVWRNATGDAGGWERVVVGGFGDSSNWGIFALASFNNFIFAGTTQNGARVFSSSTGDRDTWGLVSPDNFGENVRAMAVFNTALYASTDASHVLEVWRSASGSLPWSRVVANGFDATNSHAWAMADCDGHLWVGTDSSVLGAQVWRSTTGDEGSWSKANTNGFGVSGQPGIGALACFHDTLYAGTYGGGAARVYRPSRIYGQVTYRGAGMGGINVSLWRNDGGSLSRRTDNGNDLLQAPEDETGWYPVQTTRTDEHAQYKFTNISALPPGSRYNVRFRNGQDGNPLIPLFLYKWLSFFIPSFSTSSVAGGNFNITNTTLENPPPGATANVPINFGWNERPNSSEDSYQVYLTGTGGSNLSWTSPLLGYVNQYRLNALPSGFGYNVSYGWRVKVNASDGGSGASFQEWVVTFMASTPAYQTETGGTGANRDYSKSYNLGDPVSSANGAYHFDMPLLALGGPFDLGFTLRYRSDYARGGAFVPATFWWDPFASAVISVPLGSNVYASFYLPNGDLFSFKKQGDAWAPVDATEHADVTYTDNAARVKYTLQETASYAYFQDPEAEWVYVFRKYAQGGAGEWLARLERIEDRNGNALTYQYPSPDSGQPALIGDGLAYTLTLTYTTVGGETFLQRVADQGGRQATLAYEAAAADNDNAPTLRSVTDAAGHATTFAYAGKVLVNHLIAGQTLPRGNTPYTQTYQAQTLNGVDYARVIAQRDAYNNTIALGYAAATNVVTQTRPGGATLIHEHFSAHGFPKTTTDATGRRAQYTQNAAGQLTGITDRLGDAATFGYHAATGKVVTSTNAMGQTVANTYTAQMMTISDSGLQIADLSSALGSPQSTVTFTFYSLTRVDYPDGTNEQYAYDATGNVITATDQAGGVWTYTYNARGQPLTERNPVGGVITNTYNADGTLASSRDSETGVTAFTYDAFGRLIQVAYPDGSSEQYAYNANDQVTVTTDGRGKVTTYTYDANGNLATVTDPLGGVTTLAYDLLDRLAQVTDRLGNVTRYGYDALGQLTVITDATGLVTTLAYDARGWPISTSQGGYTWQTAYDDEGVPTSWTTPSGRTVAYQTDKLGLPTRLTDPLGGQLTAVRDAMNRITSVTDPNRTTTYAYDSQGLLSGVALPGIGATTYQRDALGGLTRLTDQRGKAWGFAYSAMGRLATATDPLSRTTTLAYDASGRLATVTFPDGGALTITYDAADNVTRLHYSGGPDGSASLTTSMIYTYDDLDRLTAAGHIALAYDAESQVINSANDGVSFGASYDAGGRLQTIAYPRPDGSGVTSSWLSAGFTVTYTYSPTTGLLMRVADNLTAAQVNFVYDADLQLAGLTRSNGVNAAYTRDANGRITRIRDGALLDLRYTLDAGGQVTQATMVAPLDPAANLQPSTSNFQYDDASQIATAGYTYDPRGRLTASPGVAYTWDGASRLTGIQLPASNVQLAYNGLGELITRTVAATTTRYYYNYALGLAPIVAERQESGVRGQEAVRNTQHATRNPQSATRYYIYTPAGSLLYAIDAAAGNAVSFYHFDRNGSTLALTDGSAALTDAYAYDPYGRLLAHTGASDQPFTFSGEWGVRQEGDSGTLYHIRARYYDAATARFLSPDPIWPQADDPLQISPYAYASSNPVGFVDLTGLESLDDPIHVIDLAKEMRKSERVFQEAWLEKVAAKTIGRVVKVGGRLFLAFDITVAELEFELGWGMKWQAKTSGQEAHWEKVKKRVAQEVADEKAYKERRRQQELEWERQERMARLQENIAMLKKGAHNMWNAFPNIWRGIHRQTFAKWWALGEWVFKAR